MSFPAPDYIKNFLNNRFSRRNSDRASLLGHDVSQRSSAMEEGVPLCKGGDDDDDLDGFGMSSKDNARAHNGLIIDHRHQTNFVGNHTPKTPLQHSGSRSGTYGASEEVELNHKHIMSKFKRAKPAKIDGQEDSQGGEPSGADCEYREPESSTNSAGSCSSTGRKEGSYTSDDGPVDPYTSEDSDMDSEHCHDESDEKERKERRQRKKAMRKLVIATVLSFLFMCGEIIGGYFANSLAIMTDASHLLTDVSSFLVSIIALQMASKPWSKSMTFGWHRAEVIGAIISVLAIWVVTGVLVYLAVNRLIKNEYHLDGKTMLITASCAVGFNIVMGLVLHESHGHAHGHSHGHSHGDGHGHADESDHRRRHDHGDDGEESGNVNVRAAFIHVLGDLLQSLGVLIAAFVIYFKPEYKIADPICTFLFSLLVLATTITILRDTIVILMEGTPAGINYEKVKERLLAIPGVIAVHDLRIWSLTLNQCVMSCHLAVEKSVRSGSILKRATRTMKAAYNFHSMTIQVETYSMDMDDCKKCDPKANK